MRPYTLRFVRARSHSVGLSPSSSAVVPAGDDWAARIVGSFFSTRLDSSALVDTYKEVDENVGHISFDTTLSPAGGGSMKIAVLNTDVASSGLAGFPFGQDFTDGGTFWTSFRVHAPPEFCYQLWPTSAGVGGHKLAIISNHPTNKVWEVVWQVSHNRNILEAYHQDGAAFPPFDEGAVTSCSGSDFKEQPKVDNGANPLTSTNPDTGSAWSTCEQDRARFGGLFSAQSLSEFAYGYGDRFDGGFRQVPNEWLTLTSRIQVGNFGSANSRVTLWAARPGQPYVKIIDKSDTLLGTPGPFNKLWLLPYVTNRVAGGRKIGGRTNNITGVTLKACGLGTPIGDGTLSYTASTQRFQWKGTGESYGTARGFSAANGKLLLNVKDSVNSASGSYVLIEVAPGSLPGSDQTDTVTIADGRPDTQINYADVILSAASINAPGGYSPPLDSALSIAAASLAAGDWTTLTCNYPTTLADLVDSGGGKRITEYADKMAWDAVRKRIYFTGQGHLQTMKTIQYDDATNAWSNVGTPPWWSAGMFFHAYGHNALIGSTHYVLQYGTTTIRTRDALGGNTTWGTLDTTGVALGSDGAIGSLEYFPSYGSGGSLIIVDGNGDGLFRWNAGSWTNIGTPTIGGHSNFGVYTPIKDLMYLGGGSSSAAMYTLSNTGTLTAKTAAPVNIGVIQSVNTVDPVSGKFIAITIDKTVRVFDPVANTWGTDTAPPAGFWSGSIYSEGDVMGILACPIPDYGVTLFVTLGSSTIYLRKGRA